MTVIRPSDANHSHPSEAHKAACPVCNPDKTVPQLNAAYAQVTSNELLAAQCDEYAGWITVPLAACDVLRRAAKALRSSSETEAIGTIEWSETRNPDNECHYHHIIGQTPFGRVLITWKGWKDYPSPTVDESPWGFTDGAGDPESTKRMIEAEYNTRLRAALNGSQKANSCSYCEAGEPRTADGFHRKAEGRYAKCTAVSEPEHL